MTFRNLKENEAALQNALDEVQRLASTDYLTGLHNRRHFMELAEYEFNRAHRYSRLLFAIMLDIDLFKQVNDTHGHAVGDQVLREIAECCHQTKREVDIVGRVGGEEFAILLPESDLAAACQFAERLRQIIAHKIIKTESGPVMVTASLGAATLDDECFTLDNILASADQALYTAKRNGRNRVCCG